MAIRALLLSADPQAVPAVTQVLKELDLAFDHCDELSAGIESLAHQHFDVILVDCDREQDAAPVFEQVRSSTLQKTSITIAIVEGRTGVPSAFHLGAMLVLTKPVSVEQARNTLRTALSMLRKEGQAGKGILASAAAAGAGNAVSKAAIPNLEISQELAHEEVTPVPLSQLRPSVAVLPLKTNLETAGRAAHPAADSSAESDATGELASTSSSTPPRPAIGAVAAKGSDVPAVAAPSSNVPPVDDDPILAELEEAERKTKAPAPRAQKPAKPQQNRTPLLAAVAVVLLGAVLYAAWGAVPQFRNVVTFEYQKTKLQIAGLQTKPHTTASAVPVQPPSQAARSVATPTTGGPSVAPAVPAAGATPSSADVTVHPAPTTPQVAAVPSQPTLQNVKQDSANNVALVPLASTNTTQRAGSNPPNDNLVLDEDVADANVVHRVSPIYPQKARQKKAHGPVVLQATVDKDGNVDFVKVVDGNSLLISAAVDAVRQWRYKPYIRNGEAVGFVTQVTVDFR